MSKQVVLIGHCGADTSYLKLAIKAADAEASVVSAESEEELAEAMTDGASLVLVNRVVDYGFKSGEGVDIVRAAKQLFPEAKFMVISNYPEAQTAAIAAGAMLGFGKREIGTPKVKELLKSAMAELAPVAK